MFFFDSQILHDSKKYKGLPYIRIAALYTTENEKIRISKEHEDYKWVEFEEALKLDLTDFTRKALLAWEVDIEKFLSRKTT